MSATIRGMIEDKLITHSEVTEISKLFAAGKQSRIYFIHEERPNISEVFKGLDVKEIEERKELLKKAHGAGLLSFVATPKAAQSTGYYAIRPVLYPLLIKYVESKK